MTHIPTHIRSAFSKRPEKKWPTHDGKPLDRLAVLNASEAGACIRQLRFARMHPDITRRQWSALNRAGYAERGHAVEAWVNSMFELHNQVQPELGRYEMFGNRQVSLRGTKLSATLDALFLHDDAVHVIDIKSIDPRTNWNNLPKPRHVTQIKQGMCLVDELLGLTPTLGKLLYVDASNFNNMVEIEVEYEPEYADYLLDRADRVLSDVAPHELPAEGVANGECDWCPFVGMCNDVHKAPTIVIDDTTKELLNGVFS